MGYVLVIAEKPDAARRIAEALAEHNSLKSYVTKDRVRYYSFERDGKKHVVVAAVGHLFTLAPVDSKWSYPVFDYVWRPTFEVDKKASFSRKYFYLIKSLVGGASDYLISTDFDTEGEVIGVNILRFLAGVSDAKRLKFSTLTRDELVQAYENVNPHIDFGQYEAGLTRHELDWLWGINVTRALTLSLRRAMGNSFTLLSSGRVQSPTLAILLQRELEIRNFKPTPYWQVRLLLDLNGKKVFAEYEKEKIWNKEEADRILNDCKGRPAVVRDIKKSRYKQLPPFPFNTTDLQVECYNAFGFSPQQTMEIAEALYQEGYISYPRSSSQKIPEKVNYERILRSLALLEPYRKFAYEILRKPKLVPNEGPQEDPAHYAVITTWEVPDLNELSPSHRKVYDLIARRTLATFSDPAIKESSTILLDVNGHNFILRGKRILELGWLIIYEPYVRSEEVILPELKLGEILKVLKVEEVQKETQPPARYSQGSIIREMESRGLGTRATRSEILQTLYDRNYITGKSIHVTKVGEVVVNVLKEYVPKIVSEELTRKFEEEIELVKVGKKKREEVIEEAKVTLKEIMEEFKRNEEKIGKELLKSLREFRKEENYLGKCPKCKDGDLMIMKSRNGNLFVGCSNYPRCTNTYPLPHGAKVSSTGKVCKVCGAPIVRITIKGRRTFETCLDPNCESKRL